LLGLTPQQVRSLARGGFLRPSRGPRRSYRFSFQDLVLLRTAKSLGEAKVPARRVRRALRELARTLPRGRQLSEVRLLADGERVVVRDRDQLWQPESGQLLFDLNVHQLATRAAPIARRHARSVRQAPVPLSSEAWFELGVDLEAVDIGEAINAYHRAVELDPTHADAHVNLGRLLQQGGSIEEAARHYREALHQAPSHATAAFNLGTVLEDQGHATDAMAAYARALAIDERLADAHFNLSRLYEKAGQPQAAFRHLRTYRELVTGK
jgi:tetratricopeptide (TPR) repeat protein